MFNLIPTDPDEYKVYADWLEDQGIHSLSVRKGILPLGNESDHLIDICIGHGDSQFCTETYGSGIGYGAYWYIYDGVLCCGCNAGVSFVGSVGYGYGFSDQWYSI